MELRRAEKLQWSVGEAEADAERAGCFAEQQPRLGLVVDGATPKTRGRFGRPVERTTTERFRTRIGAVHTAKWVAGALRQPQGALTSSSARADADDRKSANRTDPTGAISQAAFRTLVFGVAVLNFLYRKGRRGTKTKRAGPLSSWWSAPAWRAADGAGAPLKGGRSSGRSAWPPSLRYGRPRWSGAEGGRLLGTTDP